MRICAITTWPPHRDGIALYSSELYLSMSKNAEIRIIANRRLGSVQNIVTERENLSVVDCWKRGNPFYLLQILNCTLKSRPDIVHLQHGWLLYGGVIPSISLPLLVLFFYFSRKPVMVTMHTVIRRRCLQRHFPLASQLARIAIIFVTKTLALFSSRIIVHNKLMKKVLLQEFNLKRDKVVVVSHGVKKDKRVLEDKKKNFTKPIILSLGFLRDPKKFELLVNAFDEVLIYHPNAKLLIVGGTHAHENKLQLTCFSHLFSCSNMNGKVVFTGFITEDELTNFILESDLILLLSNKHCYIESSGALARVADFGKPVVCSKVPKFQGDLKDGVNCIMFEPQSSEQLVTAIFSLIKNVELRKTIASNLKTEFGTKYWAAVAKEHIQLYKSQLKTSYNSKSGIT